MSNDPDLYRGLAGFRRALRQFLAFSENAAQVEGITTQQYQALLAIKANEKDAIRVKDLADELLLHHHGAVQLADRLEQAGLVQRRQSSTDRRNVLVSLTPDGMKLLERLAKEHYRELIRHEPLLAESLERLRRLPS